MRHTIVATMLDEPGVLNRVVSLFRKRSFNIDSITIGASEQPGVSRMTVVCDGDDVTIEQVEKQLYKLIEVLKVSDLTYDPTVLRELALIKVNAKAGKRGEIVEICDIFKGEIVDATPDTMMLEFVGSPQRIDAAVEMLRPYGLKEMVRSGVVAMARGSSTTAGEINRAAAAD